MSRRINDLHERIAARTVVTSTGCWEWQGSRKPNGYGETTVNNRRCYVHRVSYELHVGPIAEGMQIDHLCRNVACCNPAHLEQVTPRENSRRSTCAEVQRARHAAVTHCPRNHPYDAVNTYRSRAGKRHCKACQRDRDRARRARKKVTTT